MPINTSLARQNITYCKQLFQNRNERYLTKRETQLNKPNFLPIKRHSTNNSKFHHPKLASVLFHLIHCENRLTGSPSINFSKLNHKLDINHIIKNIYKMPSKKRINRVRLCDASQSTNSPSTSATLLSRRKPHSHFC